MGGPDKQGLGCHLLPCEPKQRKMVSREKPRVGANAGDTSPRVPQRIITSGPNSPIPRRTGGATVLLGFTGYLPMNSLLLMLACLSQFK